MRSLSKVIKASEFGLYGAEFPIRILPPERFSEPEEEPADERPAPVPLSQPAPKPVSVQPIDKAVEARCRAVLDQAFRKARQIVDSAQNYRTTLLGETAEQAKKERAEAKRRGYEEGFSLGRKEGEERGREAGLREGGEEGRKKAAAKNRKYVDELAGMIEAVERSKTTILSDFEADLKDLALTIAEAVVKKELKTDPKTMHAIILNAMDGYRNQAWVRIYVSDGTANLLLKADANIAEELKNVSDNVKVIATSGMDDGACVLETPDRVIDTGTDAQLRKIKSALDEAIRSDSL